MLEVWVDSFDDHGNWMKLRVLWGFLTMALQNHEIDDPLCEEFVSPENNRSHLLCLRKTEEFSYCLMGPPIMARSYHYLRGMGLQRFSLESATRPQLKQMNFGCWVSSLISSIFLLLARTQI
jgi:hypothetical protein